MAKPRPGGIVQADKAEDDAREIQTPTNSGVLLHRSNVPRVYVGVSPLQWLEQIRVLKVRALDPRR